MFTLIRAPRVIARAPRLILSIKTDIITHPALRVESPKYSFLYWKERPCLPAQVTTAQREKLNPIPKTGKWNPITLNGISLILTPHKKLLSPTRAPLPRKTTHRGNTLDPAFMITPILCPRKPLKKEILKNANALTRARLNLLTLGIIILKGFLINTGPKNKSPLA